MRVFKSYYGYRVGSKDAGGREQTKTVSYFGGDSGSEKETSVSVNVSPLLYFVSFCIADVSLIDIIAIVVIL